MSKEKKKTEETKAETQEEILEPQEEEAEEVEAEVIKETEKSPEEKLKDELAAEKDKYMRLYAEYDNYRKRSQSEKDRIYGTATADAVKEILPLADSVTMALDQFKDKDVPEEFKKGIELISNQLKKSFEKLGIESFCEVGDTFDPALHNAVSMIQDDSLPENAVAQVYQKGYKAGDKIIRHAMVVVANA